MLDVQLNKPLPKHHSYDSDAKARAFWRLSFRCGRDYARGRDARGDEILVHHEREGQDAYQRRLRVTKPRNHVGPIIRKYNDFVFRKDAMRAKPGSNETLDLLLEDADNKGTPLIAFMRSITQMAQIEREAYILPDTNKPADGSIATQAQADEAKIRPFLRAIPPDAVVNWRDYEGVMVEAIISFEDADGNPFALWLDAKKRRIITLKVDETTAKTLVVLGIGPATPHGCDRCPLVRVRPMFDGDGRESGESQASPLAELQQAVFNSVSLLKEELFNVTFSQIVALGVTADQVKETPLGSNRVICIPNPGGSWDTIGADPAQAASIREDIRDESRELYRIAGVSSGDPLEGPTQAESGVARAFKFNDLAANLSALADAAENGENAAIRNLCLMNGKDDPEPAHYPEAFESPVFGDELKEASLSISSGLPKVMIKKIVQRFAERNLQLSDAEKKEADAEIDAGPAEQSTNPMPPEKPLVPMTLDSVRR